MSESISAPDGIPPEARRRPTVDPATREVHGSGSGAGGGNPGEDHDKDSAAGAAPPPATDADE